MSPGKLAAQAGHAYTNTLLKALAINSNIVDHYETVDQIGTKVCLEAKDLNQILIAHEKAMHLGIPCSLITDSGHVMLPHFDGNPIVTALGIGPTTKDQVKNITKKFNLVR